MSNITETSGGASGAQKARRVDLKFEALAIPVAEVDRAKKFYGGLGWRLDADFPFDNGVRIVQFTPPGSGCSIQFGTKLTSAAPGSAQGLFLVVTDIEAAHDAIAAAGVKVSEVFHSGVPGAHYQNEYGSNRIMGPAEGNASYSSFVTFSDVDGNEWLLQEVTERFPGRLDASSTTYASLADLEAALVRASTAHGEHETRNGGARDDNWPSWYAAYLVAEQAGTDL